LVPVDGSKFSLAALPTARGLAEWFMSELHTISVADPEDDTGRLRALGTAAFDGPGDDDHAVVLPGPDVTEDRSVRCAS
jgi:hypothetical protein